MLLNFSLNTSQGLTTDDTRLVYDHISRKFHPIYYDGHVNEIITKNSDINFEIPEEIRLKLINELQLIDLKSLRLELNNHGAEFSSFSLKRIFDRAISFIKTAKKENVIYVCCYGVCNNKCDIKFGMRCGMRWCDMKFDTK